MVDITDYVSLAPSTPEEAAENVKGASLMDLGADVFREQKQALQPAVDQLNNPVDAAPKVAKYMAQSTEHTALVKDDVDPLSYIADTFDYVGSRVQGINKLSERNEKVWNKLNAKPGEWTDEHEIDLEDTNAQIAEINGRDYRPDNFKKGVGMVVEAITGYKDFGGRNWADITAITAGTTIAGAALAGPPGALALGAQGLAAGLATASVVDGFKQQTAMMYNELSTMKDDQGQPIAIDDESKRNISYGVGIVTGAIAGVTTKLISAKTPGLDRILDPASWARQVVLNPTNSAVKLALMNIGKASALGYASGSSQEIVKIVGEELAKNTSESESGIYNSIINISNALLNKNERINQAGQQSAINVAILTGVTNTVGYKASRARFESAQDRAVNNARPVGGNEPPTASPAPQAISDIPPRLPRGGGQFPSTTSAAKAAQILNFQDVIENVSQVAKGTKVFSLAKSEYTNMRKTMLEENGIENVYVDKEDLTKFASDDKKAAAVRNLIDPSGTAAAAINAPIKVPAHQWLDLVDDYPDASDIMKLQPEGPTPTQARDHVAELRKADAKRQELLAEMKPQSVDFADPEFQGASLKDFINPERFKQSIRTQEAGQSALEQAGEEFRITEQKIIAGDKLPPEVVARQQDLYDFLVNGVDIVQTLPTEEEYRNSTLDQALGPKAEPANDVFGEADYLTQPTFTEAIESVLPAVEVEKFNNAQFAARMEVVNNINATAELEMDRVRNINEEIMTEVQYQVEADRIKNDPNVKIVDQFADPEAVFEIDRFKGTSLNTIIEEAVGRHAKKGFSPLAIDPRTMPESMQQKYAENAQLKKHKVFVKGGITANDAAQMLGVGTGENLLHILSTTPSRQDIIDSQVEKRQKEIAQNAADATNLNEAAITRAYENVIGNHIAEMKYMKSKQWSATKLGFKRIALPIPSIQELNDRAQVTIGTTRIKDLDPNQFRVGERKSQRMAIQNILKNEVEEAFKNKEAAALNVALVKETGVATGKVNRATRRIKRFMKTSNQDSIKEAGKIYQQAADEILDVFNLVPNKKATSVQGAYSRYVKDMVEKGRGDFTIPDHLADTRQAVNELTVDQYLTLADRLDELLWNAKRKNRLFNEYGKTTQMQTEEALAKTLGEVARENPDFNENRIDNPQGAIAPTRVIGEWFTGLHTLIANAEHTILHLDNEKIGGLYNETIIQPLKGVGKFKGQGLSYAGEMQAQTKLKFQEHIKAYNAAGAKPTNMLEKVGNAFAPTDFEGMATIGIFVPEFAETTVLNKGNVTKLDLFMMMLNNGNAGNREARLNFGIDNDVIDSVIERELDERDAVLAQRIFDMYESFRPKVEALEIKTKGKAPEMVTRRPFTHKGKAYPGGYFPIRYTKNQDAAQVARDTAERAKYLAGLTESHLDNSQYATGMTRQGHVIERVGSQRPLNLNARLIGQGFEEVIHDLAMRVPIIDTLQLLKNPTISKDMMSVIGRQKFNLIVNTVVDAANSVQMDNNRIFSEENGALNSFMNHLDTGFSTVVLVGNLGSIMIQPVSMMYAWEKMGPKGGKHLVEVMDKLLSNFQNFKDFYELAASIDPTIEDFRQGIDENATGNIFKLMPKKRMIAPLDPMLRFQEFVRESGFNALGMADLLQKVVVALAGYAQFTNGDAHGWGLDQIVKMTALERHEKASGYASSLRRLTLTSGDKIDRAPIQKLPIARYFVRFWNDARNSLNNSISQGRKMRRHFENINAALGEGGGGNGGGGDFGGAGPIDLPEGDGSQGRGGPGKGFTKAAKHSIALGNDALKFIMFAALIKLYTDTVRGNDTPFNGDEKWSDPDARPELVQKTKDYFMRAPVYGAERILDQVPILRDVKYAAENPFTKGDYKQVGIPIVKVFSDMATAYVGLKEYVQLGAEAQGLSEVQTKALLSSLGYVTGGWPINGLYKLKNSIDDNFSVPDFLKPSAVAELQTTVDKYVENSEGEIDDAYLKELEAMSAELAPINPTPSQPDSAKSEIIPDGALDIIKHIESRGQWDAQNPNSSAAGLYQFTEGTWADVMDRAPELGLTEEGRISADTTQQEKAANWFTEQNAKALQGAELPVTTENLYAAHFLGAKKAVEVLGTPGSEKLKGIVGDRVMEANDFRSSMKVKDFKAWVSRKVQNANIKVMEASR